MFRAGMIDQGVASLKEKGERCLFACSLPLILPSEEIGSLVQSKTNSIAQQVLLA